MKNIISGIAIFGCTLLFPQVLKSADGAGSLSVPESQIILQSTETDAAARADNITTDPFVENGLLGHFTWGADIASGVDLTAHDMTNFTLGAMVGYKDCYFRLAGIGASIMSMMNNSSRCYPIYAILRTSFSKHRQLCFMELRGGISINNVLDSRQHTGAYASAGVGVTLAHNRTFSSHLTLRCEVIPLKGVYNDPALDFNYTLALACIGIGIAF